MTTFNTTAFSVSWNESGNVMARLGYEWGNAGKPYDEYGTITARFSEIKSGSGGGFSFIGVYGWSSNPCIEWYIIDDSYNDMPFNPGNTTNMGEVDIDGGTYILLKRQTNGVGGSRCNGITTWMQYYSVRNTARQCGTISVSEHFNAWIDRGMPLGTLLETKILVEVGGGTGTVDFPLAEVTATSP